MKNKKPKIQNVKRTEEAPESFNPVAKHANKFNTCKVIDEDKTKYNRKSKHKKDYSGEA